MLYMIETVPGVEGMYKIVRKAESGQAGQEIAIMASPQGNPERARAFVVELVDAANAGLQVSR